MIAIIIGDTVVANPTSLPTTMESDQLIYDQGRKIVTANGNVTVVQNGQTLRADKLIYNFQDDLAYAEGNVTLTDDNGDRHFADVLELSDQMRQGMVQNLLTRLEDGSRLWASQAIRESQTKHVLKDARYTPCKECENDPDKTPVWALRASQVTHDKESATISYDNARFEAMGVPIAYIPYFSHADGTIKQKSGFLTPLFGYDSDDGFNVMSPYYWALSPSLDLTAGLRVFSNETPQLNLEMRKRFENASIITQTSFTSSDRVDSVNGIDTYRDNEFRGHLAVDAVWDMNRKWRSGAEISLASDEQYLDQYDISDENVLENRFYVERFDNRDYASVQLLAWQDLRLDRNVDQPNALPFANMSFIGAPDSIIGGRMESNTSFLTLYREGNEQDVNRISSTLKWKRSDILPLGLTSDMSLSLRGDGYYTTDRDLSKTNPSEDKTKFDDRLIPTANYEIGYPLQKPLSSAQVRLKPRVGITARPDVDNDSDIPNEDSSDAQLDISNLYSVDRFPGLDRVEDRTHVNYGVEGGIYYNNGNEFTGAIGQSYRLENQDNPFSNGSGLNEQSSDIVGRIGASFDNHTHNFNYRFQLNGQHLNAERHELHGQTTIYDTRLSAIYLFDKGNAGTEFTESREQIRGAVNHRFNDQWGVYTSVLYDMGVDDGLREASLAISYDDDCFGITTELQRELQSEASGSSDTNVFVRLRLKNLGEFETTAYDASTGDDEE